MKTYREFASVRKPQFVCEGKAVMLGQQLRLYSKRGTLRFTIDLTRAECRDIAAEIERS